MMEKALESTSEKSQIPIRITPAQKQIGNSGNVPNLRVTLRRYLIALVLGFIFIVHIGLGRSYLTLQISKTYSPPPSGPPEHPCISTVPPISAVEYISRQNRLAELLQDLGGVAYIAEPGAQTQFFGNFSATSWKLSERPLLLIITPEKNAEGDGVTAKVSVLTPKFEATRAKLLDIPSAQAYIEWAEEEDPYAVAAEALNFTSAQSQGKKIYIDGSARHFHYDGFQRALAGSGIVVTSASKEINQLRERKSGAEIELLKCVNEATLVAMRYVHKQMYIGIRESEARNMMSAALSKIGLSDGGCLTLFGENAALPHGSGTDKKLGPQDFALFDCTGNRHGYWSDITRTVALPSSKISVAHHQKFQAVRLAQNTAIKTARGNITARDVDKAARWILHSLGGLDKYFTHRLGHGIGLEVHEQPYLNGASMDIIQTGHTFSNEPGVYVEGEVGVRLEDCFFIDTDGKPVYLTAGVGGPSKSPFAP